MKSFAAYFDVSELSKYHRVILMEDFMKHLADKVWPSDKRKGRYLKWASVLLVVTYLM